MQIALIGFALSGKTTVFNALTGAQVDVAAYSTGKAETHRATVEVPDQRLDDLCAMFDSKKLVHATIDYVDPVGIQRDSVGQGSGLGDDMLHAIADADALAAVIRGFQDASGADCDPEGDFEAISLELTLSDLQKVDNRLERISGQIQRVGGDQKRLLQDEQAVLSRLKEALEDGRPVRSLGMTHDEARILRSFQFLTSKPLLVVLNTAEGTDASGVEATLERMRAMPGTRGEDATPWTHFMALCGSTEMEIAQLDEADRGEFLAEYGLAEPGAQRMIRFSYDALGLISFFTVGPKEAHAWTIPGDTPAVHAAGTIHSDLERGFIRAEVIGWNELLDAGSMAEAKKRGQLRLEGKEYRVQDGDVIEIRFSV